MTLKSKFEYATATPPFSSVRKPSTSDRAQAASKEAIKKWMELREAYRSCPPPPIFPPWLGTVAKGDCQNETPNSPKPEKPVPPVAPPTDDEREAAIRGALEGCSAGDDAIFLLRRIDELRAQIEPPNPPPHDWLAAAAGPFRQTW